jgi:predicted deacylase
VEIGNPQQFQNQFIEWSSLGLLRILTHLGMIPSVCEPPQHLPSTYVCSRGFWLYTEAGGVLEVYPCVNSIVRKGDLIARIKTIFGNVVAQVRSPCSGIVIGRSSNPGRGGWMCVCVCACVCVSRRVAASGAYP